MKFRYLWIFLLRFCFLVLIRPKCFSIDFISLLEKRSIGWGRSRQSWNYGRINGSGCIFEFRLGAEVFLERNFLTVVEFFKVKREYISLGSIFPWWTILIYLIRCSCGICSSSHIPSNNTSLIQLFFSFIMVRFSIHFSASLENLARNWISLLCN